MADLLVIVPTRGRPDKAAELLAAVRETATSAEVAFAIDSDDPCTADYLRLDCGWLQTGPRQGLAAWTNEIAVAHAHRYRALASIGDDHRPRTPGWDAKLLAALDRTGGTGIAYGDDLLQGARVPTAAVVSSDIVQALGWMCLPSVKHYYCDDAWKYLGGSAGCLHYVPEVVIEHLHPLATGDEPDATYTDAYGSYQADRLAFRKWRNTQAAADVEMVKRLIRVSA